MTTRKAAPAPPPDRFKVELTKDQVGALMAPLSPARVAKLDKGGATLSYVEAWDIKAALIRVFGFGGFSVRIKDSQILQIREAHDYPQHVYNDGKARTPQVIAQATCLLTVFGIGPNGEDVCYEETAIGTNSGWDIGDAADNAIKTAASDALKRCAIFLGTQFGLSLYDSGATRDVVRTLLTPEQAALHKAYLAERQAAFDAQTQANMARALGVNPEEVREEVSNDGGRQ